MNGPKFCLTTINNIMEINFKIIVKFEEFNCQNNEEKVRFCLKSKA